MSEIIELYALSYLIFLIIIFIIFKRFLYSILDPHILLIQLLASSLAFSINSPFFLYLTLSILAFWLGMITVSSKITRNNDEVKIINLSLLKVYTIILFIIYIIANIILYKDAVIPLLSDNPTESKISSFSEGTGGLRRVIFVSSILPICFSLLILFVKKKKFYILCLLCYIFISTLLGSKSSILYIIFLFSFLYTQKNLKKINFRILKKFKRLILLACLFGLFIFIFIVLKESEFEDNAPFNSILYRLMASGDVMLYYKNDWIRNAFSEYTFLDFIPDEINGITGMFRLTSYKNPIGYIMIRENLGDDLAAVLGPNTPFFIKGHIYFGYIGGIIFSYFIGFIYANFRNRVFVMRINDIFLYAIYLNIFFLMINFLKESGMFISRLFDFFLISIPIVILSKMIIISIRNRPRFISVKNSSRT